MKFVLQTVKAILCLGIKYYLSYRKCYGKILFFFFFEKQTLIEQRVLCNSAISSEQQVLLFLAHSQEDTNVRW